jgi:hypothetical protein
MAANSCAETAAGGAALAGRAVRWTMEAPEAVNLTVAQGIRPSSGSASSHCTNLLLPVPASPSTNTNTAAAEANGSRRILSHSCSLTTIPPDFPCLPEKLLPIPAIPQPGREHDVDRRRVGDSTRDIEVRMA